MVGGEPYASVSRIVENLLACAIVLVVGRLPMPWERSGHRKAPPGGTDGPRRTGGREQRRKGGRGGGISSFLRDSDRVFHTCAAHERAQEGVGSTGGLLDLTALGRSAAAGFAVTTSSTSETPPPGHRGRY